jgi:hypothetical protein
VRTVGVFSVAERDARPAGLLEMERVQYGHKALRVAGSTDRSGETGETWATFICLNSRRFDWQERLAGDPYCKAKSLSIVLCAINAELNYATAVLTDGHSREFRRSEESASVERAP